MIARHLVGCIVVGSLAGCLYLDGINHAPEFDEVFVVDDPDDLVVKGKALLRARAIDEDDDTLRYRWYVAVRDLDDERYTPNSRGSYPLTYLSNFKALPVGGHPKTILFLTADANGES